MKLSAGLEVLWADDEREYVDSVFPFIADLVLECKWVPDGGNALLAMRSGHFDLILLDLRMPPGEWGGLEVLKEAGMGLTDEIPFIVLSGAGTLRQCIRAVRLGAADYVEKEHAAKELKSCIERVLGERRSKRRPSAGESELAAILLSGEGPRVEFKSSLRWDVRESRKNAALEKATLKTVAGFLNAEGGTLILGVGDDGLAVGLENDYSTLQKANRDGFGLHLTSVLLEKLGKDLAPCIAITFHRLSEKDLCRVEVRPSPRPVLLVESGKEVFYLRTGNSTRPLTLSELLAYQKSRWGASSED